MAEGAKLVTSEPDIPEAEEETGDTKRPVALLGVSHEYLDSQQSEETKSNKIDGRRRARSTPGVVTKRPAPTFSIACAYLRWRPLNTLFLD